MKGKSHAQHMHMHRHGLCETSMRVRILIALNLIQTHMGLWRPRKRILGWVEVLTG